MKNLIGYGAIIVSGPYAKLAHPMGVITDQITDDAWSINTTPYASYSERDEADSQYFVYRDEMIVIEPDANNDYWWWYDVNAYPSVHDATDVYAYTIEGRYITFTWLPSGNMRLDLTPTGREEAEYQIEQANNKRLSDDIFLDLIEDVRANGYITLDPDDDGRNTIILGAWDWTPEEDEPQNDTAYWRDLNSAPYWYDDEYVFRLILDDLILFYDDPREEATTRFGLNRKFPVVLRRGTVPLLYLADSEE